MICTNNRFVDEAKRIASRLFETDLPYLFFKLLNESRLRVPVFFGEVNGQECMRVVLSKDAFCEIDVEVWMYGEYDMGSLFILDFYATHTNIQVLWYSDFCDCGRFMDVVHRFPAFDLSDAGDKHFGHLHGVRYLSIGEFIECRGEFMDGKNKVSMVRKEVELPSMALVVDKVMQISPRIGGGADVLLYAKLLSIFVVDIVDAIVLYVDVKKDRFEEQMKEVSYWEGVRVKGEVDLTKGIDGPFTNRCVSHVVARTMVREKHKNLF